MTNSCFLPLEPWLYEGLGSFSRSHVSYKNASTGQVTFIIVMKFDKCVTSTVSALTLVHQLRSLFSNISCLVNSARKRLANTPQRHIAKSCKRVKIRSIAVIKTDRE